MSCLALGLDFGTSGARAVLADPSGKILWQTRQEGLAPTCRAWHGALLNLIAALPIPFKPLVTRLAIAGTSATTVLCDGAGRPVAEPLLYNDSRAQVCLAELAQVAPPGHLTLSATSSLAKLFWYRSQPGFGEARHLLHQADWLAACLHGRPGWSDWHNALKLGYDPATETYPAWLRALPFAHLLPQVVAPGTPLGTVLPDLGLCRDCVVCAGTTDSMAALIASGAGRPGDAVTSLGSTLVLKLVSEQRLEDNASGVYSHRLGQDWAAGGASNCGGAVLRHFFSDLELVELSTRIDPEQPSPLNYYPLLRPGERFPIHDPHLDPRLEPRPADPVEFLHGLLESLARIEAQGYQKLQALGGPPVVQVLTAGGGSRNPTWTHIRQRHLGVPVRPADHQEAAYGAARLAALGGLV
ncbi:MAG: FGGY-family carbohydrate kinase [Gloeomargaritaceae cyanobacterium C42_A2020_066]|nr:FGGY-family carbohydrate kinase [Gloeomargaritaceae cyanobacterium C42_A2020_066]